MLSPARSHRPQNATGNRNPKERQHFLVAKIEESPYRKVCVRRNAGSLVKQRLQPLTRATRFWVHGCAGGLLATGPKGAGAHESGDVKGTIRNDVRYRAASNNVRRHRLISISYMSLLPCHGRGREFESRRPRHSFQALATLTSSKSGDVRGR